MGRPPAYIFIVRHGNRLDAADKLWHLSSPTPYDPPLTYGGWSQSRAIGQRIADILRGNAVLEPALSSAGPGIPAGPDSPGGRPPPRKKRYKVVIHSSPFLRCVQTSIALSSGIASDAAPLESLQSLRTLDALPPLRAPTAIDSVPQNGTPGGESTPKPPSPKIRKSVMRLDAFLGEWLSPGYFELIAPPPSSVMMVAGAKAELLRREGYSTFHHAASHHAAHAHSHSTSQLWESSRSNSWSARPAGDDEPPKSGSQHVPFPGLFNSGADSRPASSNGSMRSPRLRTESNTSMHPPRLAGYVPPVPHFALSSNAPTPADYIAHARDACVGVDFQWDSMRAPYDWGNGGEFGEEWTAMHRRFRKGLQKLVDWYATSDAPAEMVTPTVQFKPRHKKTESRGSVGDDSECAIDDDGDGEGVDDDGDGEYTEESVVVLVTHGAGCNALIGAITQQPVLMDVGLASLSVAARRPGREELPTVHDAGDVDGDSHASKWTGSVHSGYPGGLVPLTKYYEMRLLANSDHLRSLPSTPTTPRLGAMASVIGGTRGRHSNSLSGTPGNYNHFGNGTVGQRSSSAGSSHADTDVPTRRASSRPPLSSRYVAADNSRSSSTNGRATGGITIGSGVTTFSPPTISTSRLRPASIGLWSPVSAKDLEEETFSLDDDGNGGNDDDDIEILLSFGPESPQPPKKAPSIRGKKGTGASDYFYPAPSSLSISHTATQSDNDRHNDQTAVDRALETTVKEALPRLDIGASAADGSRKARHAFAATTASARSDRSVSPSLWTHPRVASLSGDEPAHDSVNSKRRWTVNEPPV